MYLWCGDRSFLIAAASPSVSRVPEDWKINVKKLARRAPETTAAEVWCCGCMCVCDVDAVSVSILFSLLSKLVLYPFWIFSELEHSSGARKKFFFQIQKVNGVAPRPGNLAKKFLPKRRAEVLRFGACLDFFFFPFRRGNLFRVLTEVTDFSRGVFVLFYFVFLYVVD
jgi:hypothetical protein